MPNVINPNSVNNNALFTVSSNEEISLVQFDVFDRWGNVVYEEAPSNLVVNQILWDGRSNDQPLITGVYVYRLRYIKSDDQIENHIGDILVLK